MFLTTRCDVHNASETGECLKALNLINMHRVP